jgi:NAD(P)H-nitrite reductase large subunit
VLGHCRLLSSRSAIIEIEAGTTQEIHFEKAALSIGSVPFMLPIRGVEHAGRSEYKTCAMVCGSRRRLKECWADYFKGYS